MPHNIKYNYKWLQMIAIDDVIQSILPIALANFSSMRGIIHFGHENIEK